MSRRFMVTGAAAVAAGAALLAAGAGVARAGAASHAAAATHRCERRQLSLAPPASNGALGSIGLRFTFTNTSATACHLFGFPGIRLRHRDGRPLPTTVVRGTNVVVPFEPERTVTLAPGGRASFFAGYSDVPTGNQRCPSSSLAQVWAPNDFRSSTVPMRATACGGVITVSPVVPGRPRP